MRVFAENSLAPTSEDEPRKSKNGKIEESTNEAAPAPKKPAPVDKQADPKKAQQVIPSYCTATSSSSVMGQVLIVLESCTVTVNAYGHSSHT